ncbi:hypothetical protein SUGI_1075960 [Cryptomeria japonica]|nr:hypothetical protein SUGI_1075960 [Cryptomeria japonica]
MAAMALPTHGVISNSVDDASRPLAPVALVVGVGSLRASSLVGEIYVVNPCAFVAGGLRGVRISGKLPNVAVGATVSVGWNGEALRS